MGNLCRNPELRYTNSGKAVLNGTLAVDRFGRQEPDFIDFTAWGKCAENTAQYCHKGDAIVVNGALQVDAYDDKDGNKRRKAYINAQNVTFLNLGKKKGEVSSDSAEDDSDIPF